MPSSIFECTSSTLLPAYTPEMDAVAGRLESLGSYRIKERIAAGAMGSVYQAVDARDATPVALKVLDPNLVQNETLAKRFKVEARAAMRLNHPNIVRVIATGTCDSLLFIAMEFITGPSLHDLIAKQRQLAVERSLEIMQQVTRGLSHAAAQGIVHRDIKPANILITDDGTAKLTDFGLARVVDETLQTELTHEGMTVGTVEYIAPEQARDSRAADVRSDIYSLGCTWYHMLVGRPPFSEGDLRDKMSAHVNAPPPDPRVKNPRVPVGVVGILDQMLAKKPADRHQTPARLLQDLESDQILREEPSDDILRGLADGLE